MLCTVVDVDGKNWDQLLLIHVLLVEHVERMHHRMTKVWPLIREHMQQALEQAWVYNRGQRVWSRTQSHGLGPHECLQVFNQMARA